MNWKRVLGIFVLVSILAACGEEEKPPAETKRAISSVSTEHEAGKKLFFTQCGSCHMVNKELTGPALKGVESRWPDKQKLYAFIKNSADIIATDAYAKNLWQQYNQTPMPAHPDLTDENIRSILDYIEAVSEK